MTAPAPVPADAGDDRPRILFVDGESDVLAGLRRVFRPLRQQWDVRSARSGAEALAMLAAAPFDVLITDLRLPGMDGPRLLAEVVRRHPEVVRVVLSGYAEKDTALRSLDTMHQYLSKPCDLDTLQGALARACRVRDLLVDPELKRLVGGLASIPSLPALYDQLIGECQSPKSSVTRIGEIVAQDPGMTAKILQLVNSAFFGLRQPVYDPAHAVQLLGLDTIKALALLSHVFSRFEGHGLGAIALQRLWEHSMAVGNFARLIARQEGADPDVADQAAVAGLLHDAGRLVLAATLGDRYARAVALAVERGTALAEAEQELFGATHEAVGAYVLALWALPDAIVEAVACHHAPASSVAPGLSPVTLVHAADAIAHDLARAEEGAEGTRVDTAYLADVGVAERFAGWREACLTRARGESARG